MDFDFDIGVERRGDATLVRIWGELDLHTAPRLRVVLMDALSSHPAPTHLVVEMSTVDFIDSVALGILVGAKVRADKTGVAFRIVAPKPEVLRVFQTAGLDQLLRITPDIAAALHDQRRGQREDP